MTTKTIKTKTVTERKNVIYCGPTLDNGNIQQFSVFQGELPEHVKVHLKNPDVKELFVTPSELPKIRKNINIPGTLENQLYLNALKYAKGGK